MSLYPRNETLLLIDTLQTAVDHFYVHLNSIDETTVIEELGSSLKRSCADITNSLERLKGVLEDVNSENVQLIEQNNTLINNLHAINDVERKIVDYLPKIVQQSEILK